jgi:hypothetical protein
VSENRINTECRSPESGRPTDFATGVAGAWIGIDFARGKDWTTVVPWPPEKPMVRPIDRDDEVQP